MVELMMKMTFWLVAAVLLGFLIAWLLSRIFYMKQHNRDKDSFEAIIFERNNLVTKLEEKFREEQTVSEQLINDLESIQEVLDEKSSSLTSLKHKLEDVDDNINFKQEGNLLKLEVQKLKEVDAKRLKELSSFEEVLMHAEEKFEGTEKDYKQLLNNLEDEVARLTLDIQNQAKSIRVYKKKIFEFEEELKLYEADKTDSEFIISKDQFQKIEEQLETYQKEIVALKSENDELKFKKNSSEMKTDEIALANEVVDKVRKENDDSTMVKAFRETYKKITKS